MLSIKRAHQKKRKKTNFVFALSKCPHRKGIVRKLRIDSPRKPNSAKRCVAKVELTNNRWVLARVKGSGHNLQPYSNVLISGGRANDVPGVRYTIVRGALDLTWHEKFSRKYKRSKYGIPKNEF